MEEKAGKAVTVAGYLAGLPPDRRRALSRLRATIRANLPAGYKEMISFGMIAYVVPLRAYPNTYNGQPLMVAALASQKNYMSLHLVSVYVDTPTGRWFAEELRKAGRKLDMGKACIRFKKIEDLPLELVGRTIARVSVKDYVSFYDRRRKTTGR